MEHGFNDDGWPRTPETNACGRSLYSQLVDLARKTAKVFHDEFPGEELDPGATDWDAVAWEVDLETILDERKAACDRFEEDYDPCLQIYSEALYAEVDRLNDVSGQAEAAE